LWKTQRPIKWLFNYY
ncbi:histidine kinase-, DNA gyrase B-, and HSP90-like ATPase family protein, partial [Vibrio cholerae HC-59A1]